MFRTFEHVDYTMLVVVPTTPDLERKIRHGMTIFTTEEIAPRMAWLLPMGLWGLVEDKKGQENA